MHAAPNTFPFRTYHDLLLSLFLCCSSGPKSFCLAEWEVPGMTWTFDMVALDARLFQMPERRGEVVRPFDR